MSSTLHPLIERAAANGVVLEMKGAVALVRLCRPAKRNALSDTLIEALRDIFQNLPAEARAAVVHGEGDHFCAGLDLSELKERDAGEGVHHSRSWHAALETRSREDAPEGGAQGEEAEGEIVRQRRGDNLLALLLAALAIGVGLLSALLAASGAGVLGD